MAKLQEQTAGPWVASGVSSFCSGVTGSDDQIELLWWTIEEGRWSRRLSKEREVSWCEEIERGTVLL
jgi:hypothetical protein